MKGGRTAVNCELKSFVSRYVCDQSADHPAVKVFDSNVQLMYLLGEGKGSGDKNMMTPAGVVLAE